MTTRLINGIPITDLAEALTMIEPGTDAGEGEHKHLTDGQRAETIDRVREIQVAEEVPNTVIARILGCSAAVWSQVRKGTYKGDVDRYVRRAAGWLARRTERADAPASEYVPTDVGRSVMAICQRAWSMPTIGVIATPSGAGKSISLAEWARKRQDMAVLLTAGECMSSRSAVLSELFDLICPMIRKPVGVHGLYRAIRGALADQYAGGTGERFCLLIDEATTLTPSAKHTLRNLHDDPAVRCGVVFADTARLTAELSGRGGNALYEQLRSRGGAQFLMTARDEISAADVRAVTDAVLAALGHRGGIGRPSRQVLGRLAQRDGKLRNVVNRLHAAHDCALLARGRPTYSVAEIDCVAPLVGGRSEMDWSNRASPFGRRAAAAPPLVAAKAAAVAGPAAKRVAS